LAISTDINEIWESIRAGEAKRDEMLESWKEQIEAYHGFKFRSADGAHGEPENTAYEYLSSIVPRMVWNNPRVRIDTRRPTAQRDVAEAIEWGINRWIRDVDLKTTLQEIAVDYIFKWGVAMVSLEPRKDNSARENEDPPMWPSITRISLRDFGWDPNAPSFKKARMMWHRYLIDKEDLVKIAKEGKDEGWNLEAVEGLAAGAGVDEVQVNTRFARPRKEIVVHEVWFPELEDEERTRAEGFNGMIYTLAQGQHAAGLTNDPSFIREPRPFFGPRWGPYTLFGVYTVPDVAEPLGPLTAIAAQNEQLNRQARALDRANEKFKQLVFVAGDDPDLQTQIKEGKDQFVFPCRNVEDVRAEIASLPIGGAHPIQYEAYQLLKERVNRALGLDEVNRGNISGEGTATEVTAAVAASENRLGYIVSQFAKGAEQAIRTVAWYLYHDDEVVFPLGPDALEAFQPPDGSDLWFKGGTEAEGSGATFDDLELEIDVYSMEKTSEVQLRRKSAFQLELMTTLGPLLPQLEAVGWNTRKVLKALGEAENIPDLDDKVDWAKLAEISQNLPDPLSYPQLTRNVGQLGQHMPSFIGRSQAQNAQQGMGKGAPQGMPAPAPAPQGAQTQPEFSFG
jgi:hypothetical protein